MLSLKVTQLWNVSFAFDLVKSTVNQIQYSMNISDEVWFEVYQCGTPYCAINNKKKRTRDKQKNQVSWKCGKMYTYLTELCCMYIYVYIFIIKNAKWITDHGVWFPCVIYAYHTWRLYFLTYGKDSLEFSSDDPLVIIKIKRKLNLLVHYRFYLHRTSRLIFFLSSLFP